MPRTYNKIYIYTPVTCDICHTEFKDKKFLSQHLSRNHCLTIDNKIEYSIEHFHNGVRPLCKCGCGQETRYESLGEFAIYISGHNSRIENGFKGKTHNAETREKWRQLREGKTYEEIFGELLAAELKKEKRKFRKERIILSCKYCKNNFCVTPCGKHRIFCSSTCSLSYKKENGIDYMISDDTRKKLRIAAINQRSKLTNKLIFPCYNPKSIPILEAKAKELGITDLQHAENGGEYYIPELGYWLDGYSKEKNVAFEYDECQHFTKFGNYIEKDIRRQKEIEEFLGCSFVRIKDA